MEPVSKPSKCWQLCDSKQRILIWTAVWFEQCPATETMTLPTSKIGAQSNRRMSKQSEMFICITGSKLCHCRSCFFCVWYITSGRQLRHVFAIPGWHRSYQGCLHYTKPTIPVGCLSISVTCRWWHDEFAGEPSKHSCGGPCWNNCCLQNKQQVFSNGQRSMSWAG